MASTMTGVREYRAALKRAPNDLRENVLAAVTETVNGVHARGKANIRSMVTRRSGELDRNYRKSISKKSLSGRVGYLSAKAREAAFYARFVNDGTIKMSARPFHTNAVEAEMELDEARMVAARDRVLSLLAGGGVGGTSSRITTLGGELGRRR